MDDKNISKIAKECLQHIKANIAFITADIEVGKKFVVLLNGKIKTKVYYVSCVDGTPVLVLGFSDKKEKVVDVLEKFIEERENG